MNTELFNYISACPTAYHTVDTTRKILENNGFTRLNEKDEWSLEKNKKYFVTRNNSSIIAFIVPETLNSFMITAAHGDSPSFKIKENDTLSDGNYVRLSTEKYGGPLLSSWFDRPLSIAGRVLTEKDGLIKEQLVDFHAPVAVIPSVATHFRMEQACNPAIDLVPVFSFEEPLKKAICQMLDADSILASDLFLYVPDKAVQMKDYIVSPRIDDLSCAFASLNAFLSAQNHSAMPVMCIFDNEEVGSTTKQGAASTLLFDVLNRIADCFNLNLCRILPESMMLSLDVAHAVHPNHPELADKNHSAFMNKGIVIKHNANQKYTTDAVSSAILKTVCKKAEVPYQEYANRADMAGGSTLGNIANTQVSLNTADIGIAQLSMHSAVETAGTLDIKYMTDALKVFFNSKITADGNSFKIN